MRRTLNWLEPIFLVVGIIIFVIFLIILGTSWEVDWENMSPTLVKLLPWLVALAIGCYAFIKVAGGR